MNIGDIVIIKQSTNINLVGKMGVVVHKGTWSRDIHVVDYGYETRIDVEKLEKL
jgi:hypothetical protein